MQIWFKSSGRRLRIPVLPSSYDVTSEQDNTTMTVCNLGEISIKGKRKLRSISFSCFFPKRDDTYVDGRLKSPSWYVKQIEQMKRKGTVKLTITGSPVNMKCTIDSFEWGEQDGTGDIAYTINFKEYIMPAILTSVLLRADGSAANVAGAGGEQQEYGTSDAAGASRSEPDVEGAISYSVKAGDALSAIARATTGNSSWSALYDANAGTIGSNPNAIGPGMDITISNAKRSP